jgi:hypothetical protein
MKDLSQATVGGTLPYEPHLQSVLFWLFFRWGLFCPGWPRTMIWISSSQVARITGQWRPANSSVSYFNSGISSASVWLFLLFSILDSIFWLLNRKVIWLTCSTPSSLPSPFFFSFFGNTGIWTQGLALVKQVVYYLSHASKPLATALSRSNSHTIYFLC